MEVTVLVNVHCDQCSAILNGVRVRMEHPTDDQFYHKDILKLRPDAVVQAVVASNFGWQRTGAGVLCHSCVGH